MEPQDFPQSNFTFTKPEGWTDDQCKPLKVFKGKDSANMPVVISKWKPTPEELEQLNKGEGIYLTIVGIGMPPVSLSIGDPFVPAELING